MQAYLVRRLMESALILLGITLVTFILLYLVRPIRRGRSPGGRPPPKRCRTSAISWG